MVGSSWLLVVCVGEPPSPRLRRPRKTNPACRVHDKPDSVKPETLECANTSSLAGWQEMMVVMRENEI